MKIKLIAFTCLIFLFTSCTKETDKEETVSSILGEQILGQWVGDRLISNNLITGFVDTPLVNSQGNTYLNLHFLQNGFLISDSAGHNPSPFHFSITNDSLLTMEEMDTLFISKVNSTHLILSRYKLQNPDSIHLIKDNLVIKLVR